MIKLGDNIVTYFIHVRVVFSLETHAYQDKFIQPACGQKWLGPRTDGCNGYIGSLTLPVLTPIHILLSNRTKNIFQCLLIKQKFPLTLTWSRRVYMHNLNVFVLIYTIFDITAVILSRYLG